MYNLSEMLDFSLKYFRFINYLLAAAILIAALILTRNIVNISFSGNSIKKAAEDTPITHAAPEKKILQYASILERNPFGSPKKMEPLGGPKTADIQYGPISNLVLTGTAVGPEDLSYAIVIDKKSRKGGQEIFTYGDSVFNYGTLTKIEKETIELTRDGIAYTIKIPAKLKTARKPALTAGKSSIARKVGEREYILDRRKVQQSLDNPEKILTDARLLPNFVDGRQEGFKISEVIKGGLYHSLGLRNGDILLRINGLAISNPEVAIQAMSALRGMNSVDLDIVRSGENMSMTYQIR